MTWGILHSAIIPQVIADDRHESDLVRAMVALTLGRLIAGKTVNRDIEQALSCLGMLSRDRASLVRKKAIQALGKINSPLVTSHLERALKDADPEVVSVASHTIQNYKRAAIAQSSQKQLPRNSAALDLFKNSES